MLVNKAQRCISYLVSCVLPVALILIAYFIQTKLFLKNDVGYLLYVANSVLGGGTYGADFYETNPPLILYLYFPACLATKWLSINIVTSIRVYVFLLALLSTYLCFFALKNIIHKKDKLLLYFLLYMLIFVLFILPNNQLGQREHFLMILAFPYLFSTVLSIENKALPIWMRILIGIMAGLGFAIKPFFLIPFALIELYFIFLKRSLFASIRIEPMLIVTITVAYVISIFLWQPSYIKIIVPLLPIYFSGIKEVWWYLSNDHFLFCVLTVGFYGFIYKQDRYPVLGHILALAIIGLVIACAIPHSTWFYHVLPAVGVATLLLVSYAGQVISVAWVKHPSMKLWLQGVSLADKAMLIIVGMLLFNAVFVSNYEMLRYFIHDAQKGDAHALVTYVGEHYVGESVICFSHECFPMVYTTHTTFAGRYPFLWWLSGLLKEDGGIKHQWKASAEVAREKKYLIGTIADDLDRFHAKLAIIETDFIFSGQLLAANEVLSYLSEESSFRQAWKHYRYLTTVGEHQIYIRKD